MHPRSSRTQVVHPVHQISQLLEQFLQGGGDQSSVATAQWVPRVDLRERADAFVIQADLPGIEADAIEISMDKNILTLKGERTQAEDAEGEKSLRVERQYGPFHRRFSLPETADADGIEAVSKNGVLEVRIPKKAELKPRRININVQA